MERGIPLQPGIGDQNIDRAELRAHVGKHRLHVAFLRHVGLVRVSGDCKTLDLLDHLRGGVIPADEIHHHVRTGLTERDRDGPADTGICSRHQGFLAGQVPRN